MQFATAFLLVVSALCLFSQTNAAASDYAPCASHTAYCIGLPENCVASSNCQVLFRSHVNANGAFHLHLIGPSIEGDKYIAVGFTNSTSMSGLVVECIHSGQQSSIEFGFNTFGKHENTAIQARSDVVGFTSLRAVHQEKELRCEFQIEPKHKVTYHDFALDLDQSKYFVQLATGDYDAVAKKIKYHGKTSHVSSTAAVSLKTPN